MKRIQKIWNVVSTVLVALTVLLAVFLMGSRLLGYQCYTVLSGSMRPAYAEGDLLYVKSVDVNSIQVGDPITFVMNEKLTVATHRVVRIDAEHQRFYTKGDANQEEDRNPVHFKNVIGVPQFSIPKLGYVSNFVQTPPGLYITIAVCVFLMVAVFAPDFIHKKKKPKLQQEDCHAVSEENQRLKAELEALKAQREEDSQSL